MAVQKSHPLLQNASGHIGKKVVVKNYDGKTVITSYPDMSKIRRSKKQKSQNALFSQAVDFAKKVKADPGQFTPPGLHIKKGQSLYHAAISWFFAQHSG